MKRLIIITGIAIGLILTVASCKKESTTPFVADTRMVEIDDSLFYSYKASGSPRTPESMTYDSVHNALYFYLEGTSGKGFDIVGYNLSNGSNANVYSNTDNTWANSNGSEGQRLYMRGNELWVPGGATNQKIQRLDVGNFTMALSREFDLNGVMFGGVEGDNPYDMVELNGMLYVLTMNDFVFYGDYPNLASGKGNFTTSETSHGSCIQAVKVDNVPHLAVKCAYSGKLELRTTTGTFVRSVPFTNNNSSPLLKDSKSRLYFVEDGDNKIVRYSADLLTKEEFAVSDIYSYRGLALREESNHITIYGAYNNGIGMVRLPK